MKNAVNARLNVILCQSAAGSPQMRDLEGDLVARLIGAPGIDLSLVGDLETMDSAKTDRLVLESMAGEAAVLVWESPAASFARFAEYGIAGYRARHSLDVEGLSEPPSSGAGASANRARKVYFISLQGRDGGQVVACIEQLLQSRRTKTVSLSLAPNPPAPNQTAPETPENGNSSPGKPRTVNPLSVKAIEPVKAVEPAAKRTSEFSSPIRQAKMSKSPLRPPSQEVASGAEWDDLVQQLNDLDI